MNEATDHTSDELASAYIDGDLTDEAAAALEADPVLVERVAALRAAAEAVGAPPPPLGRAEADAMLAAALDAFDDSVSPESGAADEAPPAAPVPIAKARRPKRKIWLPPPAVAVAAVLVVAVIGIGLIVSDLSSSSSDSNATAGNQATEESADAAASLATEVPTEVTDLGDFADRDALEVSLRAVDLTLDPAAAIMAAPAAGSAEADEAAPEATLPGTSEDTVVTTDSTDPAAEDAAGGGARDGEAAKLAEVSPSAIERCDQVVRGTDSTLGERLAVASAQIAGRSTLVFSHPVTSTEEGAAPATRLTAADVETCQVIVAIQR